MTTYKPIAKAQQTVGAIVRIRRADNSDWLPCPLLASAAGWICVDDGAGPLWVALDHVNRLDWPILNLLTRLKEARN